MDPTQIGFFVAIIQRFKDLSGLMTTAAQAWVFWTFQVLVTLELARVCWRLTVVHEAWAPLLMRLVILYSILGYVFTGTHWEYLYTLTIGQGIQLGLRIAGNTMDPPQFLNPAFYFQQGLDVGVILVAQWNRVGITGLGQILLSIPTTLAYMFAWVVFLVAFLVMALTLFYLQIKTALAMPLIFVLLPALLYEKTEWIATGAIRYLVHLAYVFVALAVTAALTMPLVAQVTWTQAPDIQQALLFDVIALSMAGLFIAVPKMATNILSGIFQMHTSAIPAGLFMTRNLVSMGMGAAGSVGRGVGRVVGGMGGQFGGGRGGGGGGDTAPTGGSAGVTGGPAEAAPAGQVGHRPSGAVNLAAPSIADIAASLTAGANRLRR